MRRLLANVGFEAEQVLDWSRVTMRPTVLVQATGARTRTRAGRTGDSSTSSG